MNWTPPEDAEVSNSGWTPPEDAIPVDSKKNESSVGSLTGSGNTTPLQSTSTSEIPTVQITDGEIDAAPLNRPSTMPYGTKMGEDGKVMSDTRDINPTQREEAKKAVSKLNIQKRAEMLSAAAAKTFQENPELFSDLNNVKAYVDRVTKNYSPQDRSVIREELYKVDPRFSEERKKQLIDNAITNGIDPTGGFATGAVEGAVEGVSHGAQQIAKSTKDFTRLSMSPAKNVGEIANAVTGELAGGTQLAMGAANLFVPELAAFTIGSKAAEEKAPGISNILAPVSYLVSKHYQDKGEEAPEWASNLGALGDLALPILLGVGGKKIAEKFKDKPITPEVVQEAINETPKEDIDAAIQKLSDDSGKQIKYSDYEAEQINRHRDFLLKNIDDETEAISKQNKRDGVVRSTIKKMAGVRNDTYLKETKADLLLLENDPLSYFKKRLSEYERLNKDELTEIDNRNIEYYSDIISGIEKRITHPEEIGATIDKFSEDHGELFKQNDVAMEEANNLSSQAETLKSDLEKAKGTPAEPIIAQKIEELNTKIDEIHGKEVERQTAEAHTLSTLDHLQKQREQLVATQESLSPEGQKALEPEIKKVDDMIKEVEPKKEEAKEVIPDNEVGSEKGGENITEDFLNQASEPSHPFHELAKALKGKLGGVVTKIVDGVKDFFGKTVWGNYGNKQIIIDGKNPNQLQTFFHEAMHHFTVEKLLKYERGDFSNLTDIEVDGIKNLKRIFEESKTKLEAKGIKVGGKNGHYGFTNVHEFISEAFANPEFQRLLKELPSEGNHPTIFKAFLDAVAKMLGIKDPTILDDIFHHTEKLLDSKETKTKETKETVPDNEVAEPIKQLGTGANVYFETDKYRVNDNLKNGKVLLNVGDAKGEMPLRNVEFDTPEEAVFVAKKLQENAPNGLDSDFHNVDKIIENYKEEYRQPKNEPVVEGLMNRVGERKPTEGHYGSGENVKFTDNVAVPFRYKVIEADQLQPSHLSSGERNPNHQISLAQPKERNDAASKQAQDKIASNPNLAEVGEGPNAFFGAPVVNKAGEVIQGNNRSIGIKKHYGQKGSSYKSQLSENAEKFGLTKDQVEGMENPVLVREVAVDDNTSVQLGNFDVKDLETGGKQRIDPIVTVRKMSPESKSSLSSIVFDGDHKTIKEAIRSNIGKVAEIIKKYINPAQFAKAFNKAGEVTESGMDDISSVVNHFLFDKGDPVLPEAFSQIPDVIQKGLQKSLKYIMGSPEGKSILPETQNAVLAIYEWKQSGVADFNEWANQTDMFKGVTPKDVLSPLELELAKKLSEAKNQSDISKVFAEYNDLVSDKPADMFNDATPGLSHNDAVKKQFKLNEYERTENKPERHTEAPSIEIPVDATLKEVSREKPEPTKEPEAIKDSGELTSINDQLSDSKDYTGIKESVKESDANKFREIQETTSEAVKQKRMDNLSPEELHIEKNYGEIIKQLKASGLLEGPCI